MPGTENKPKPTGIRRTNTGEWAAVRKGRVIAIGNRRHAIMTAGTNAVIA